MKIYRNTMSDTRPMPIEVTETRVYTATNVKETDDGWEFDYTEYMKDEFILMSAQRSDELEACILELAEIVGGGE